MSHYIKWSLSLVGHSGRRTFIHAKTTSNVYSCFFPMSQQYRIIEEHPEESIITSQIQSLHITEADKITVNLSIDNQIPTIPTAPHRDWMISLNQHIFEAPPINLKPLFLLIRYTIYIQNQLGGSEWYIGLEGPYWRLLLIIYQFRTSSEALNDTLV